MTFERQRQQTTARVAQSGAQAVLRRRTGDRACLIFMTNFTPIEMMGRTAEPMTRKVLVAVTPETATTPPDNEQDRLITFKQPPTNPPTEDENLRIVEPPSPVGPTGQPVFWRLAVRR